MATNSFDTVSLSIPAQTDHVGVVRLAVSGVASRMNFSIEEIEDIKIAVSEALTNAVQYAYEGSEEGRVSIDCNIYPEEKLEIVIQDEGKGFNIAAAQKKNDDKSKQLGTEASESDEVPSLGLGMTFVKSLMDEADFSSTVGEGTTVRMAKHL